MQLGGGEGLFTPLSISKTKCTRTMIFCMNVDYMTLCHTSLYDIIVIECKLYDRIILCYCMKSDQVYDIIADIVPHFVVELLCFKCNVAMYSIFLLLRL